MSYIDEQSKDHTLSYSSQQYNYKNSKLTGNSKCCSKFKFPRFKPIVFCILIFELCERLCFYSINGNFLRFCTLYLDVSNVTALNLTFIFTGAIYFVSIIGGWMADSVLGKYRMIIFSGLIYFIGVFLITTVTFDFQHYFPNVYLNTLDRQVFSGIGLVLIAFGTGGIKTVVGPFGAEQLDQNQPGLMRLYFIWYYWFVNTGASIAFTVVAYIEQNVSFFYGFLVPLTSIVIAMIIFLIPSSKYKHTTTIENTIGNYFGIIVESLKKKRKSDHKYQSVLDYASLSNGGSYHESTISGLKQVRRILPIMFTFVPFYIVYLQLQSTFLVQGERLNLQIKDFTIPVASLNIVNTFVIIFLIPIMAVIVYPLIKLCCGKTPKPLQRIGLGLFITALSVVVAGLVEIFRKSNLENYGGIPQKVFEKTYNVSRISVLVQIPQYFFIGAGEVFAATTGLEFAFSQSPANLRSLISGVFYFMIGLASFLGSALIEIVNINKNYQWVPNDIDKGHYEYFYFLLCGILLLDVVVFIILARRYKYVEDNDDELERLIVTYRGDNLEGSVSIEPRPRLYTDSNE